MIDYEKMLQYVKGILQQYNFNFIYGKDKIRYNRYLHIRRVLKFVNKIYIELPQDEKDRIDYEAMVIAAIFHDSGYGQFEQREHAAVSEEICREYLKNIEFDYDKTEYICNVVRNHSNKELMNTADISLELLILMEADLFDDTGAHGIVTDIWMESFNENVTFETMLEHIKKYTYSIMQNNPMRTEPARKLWEEKKKLTYEFVRQYESDLEV